MTDDKSKSDADAAAARRGWVAEERWHIENATTDLSLFMRPLQQGVSIRSAGLFCPDGLGYQFEMAWSERPALVITGSLSCPPSRVFNPSLNALQAELEGRIDVFVLYVIDAHPVDAACPYTGTRWLTSDNESAGLLVNQPVTQRQRNDLARRYIKELGLQVPVLVDNIDNAAWDALGRSPNSATLIDAQGRCLLWQDWYSPATLLAQLRHHSGV